MLSPEWSKERVAFVRESEISIFRSIAWKYISAQARALKTIHGLLEIDAIPVLPAAGYYSYLTLNWSF
jgi:hypothetical protein